MSDRETKGMGADKSPEPSVARAGCRGEWGSWGDGLIAASSRDNCQHPGENEAAMQGKVIHLREANVKEDFSCSKAPAKKDEHP